MEEQNSILSVEQLSISFVDKEGKNCVVDNLSFELHKGQTIGLVGESGSGKSVSMMSVMRLLNEKKVEYSGRIVFHKDGKDIDLLSLKPSQIRTMRGSRIAMIFQEPMTSLNPSMLCGEQVMESLRLHLKMNRQQAEQRTLELFKEVLLPDPKKVFQSYPHEISGGQKQRVMIAMAMACNPDILIADEPTTALDVTVQKTIIELMKTLQKNHNMSIIFITHDLGVVAQIADDILVLYRGKKVEEGPVKIIFSHPQHAYTKGLLACRVPLDKRPKKLLTVSDFMSADNQALSNQLAVEEITLQERQAEIEKIMTRQPVLQVKNLCKSYELPKKWFAKQLYFDAVRNVSFDVFEGETLGLVGESGCGKTTLGRLILRLIEPTSGQVLYQGEDIYQMKAERLRKLRKDIQVVFQDPYSSLNPRYTIGHAITEPMKLHGIGKNDAERKEMVMNLLEKVNLEQKYFYSYPHEFSGGQRQRVCIARALALQPKFLICDESVSALDVSVQAQVLNLLNQLKKEFQLTYIFISHDLSVVKYMSHRILVMQKGAIQELNEADQLYAHPQTQYTRTLIDAIPKIE